MSRPSLAVTITQSIQLVAMLCPCANWGVRNQLLAKQDIELES
jgi:hypothetical protein